jgi:hypothetical protein
MRENKVLRFAEKRAGAGGRTPLRTPAESASRE